MIHGEARSAESFMTRLSKVAVLAGAGLLIALTGCQTTPRQSSGGAQQEKLLYRIKHWEAEGKIAIQMANDRQSASFKWAQDNGDYAIHLFGPFGQGATWLRRTSRGVVLESAKAGTHKAASAETLMENVLGWQVPVSNLQFWLRGLPAKKPKPDNSARDQAGFLSLLNQEGWQVAYSRHEHFDGWWLPTRIQAERDDLKLTLVIKRWRLPDAPPTLY